MLSVKKFKFSLLVLVFSSVLAVHSAQAAVIELVTNGSLTGDIDNAGLPDGWLDGDSGARSPSTADTMDETHNAGLTTYGFGATPSASSDGGTWVGIGTNYGLADENFYQVVSGFEIDKEYTLSWYDANFGITGGVTYTGANKLLATLTNGSSILSFTDSASRALGGGWFFNSFTFTPTQTSYTLSFSLLNPTKSYLSIDGISITTEVASVPEPSTWAFLLVGLLAMSVEVRKRQLAKVR